MIKIFKTLLFITGVLLLTSCDQILEPVKLSQSSKKIELGVEAQETFEIKIKTLTLPIAKKLQSYPYKRRIMVSGKGSIANVYDEESFLKANLPPASIGKKYLIGIGDELSFVQFIDPESQMMEQAAELKNLTNKDFLVTSTGRVGSDGSILLLGLGRIKALDRSLNEIRQEARNILIRNGFTPNFQLEITAFKSRKAYIFTPNKSSVIPITSRPTSLRELVAVGNYSVDPTIINRVLLKRGTNTYNLSNAELFDKKRSDIYIYDKDQIEVEAFKYKPGQVYALSAGVAAAIIPIRPEIRETLADAMFSPGGPLSNILAKRSGVYLLRGSKPVTAYHLDAQDVSRIFVASEMELRPDDIIFVAQRPIISFSRLLSEITPLRILLRDIQEDNIP